MKLVGQMLKAAAALTAMIATAPALAAWELPSRSKSLAPAAPPTQRLADERSGLRREVGRPLFVGRTVSCDPAENVFDLGLRQQARCPDLQAAVILPGQRFDFDGKPHRF
jgi:hypothetical protein